MSLENPEQQLSPEQERILSLENEVRDLRKEKTELQEKNDELEKMAYEDFRTGTLNPRGLDKMAKVLLPPGEKKADESREFSPEKEHVITVAMFDLDNFKQFNTEHGHAEADEVLRMAAQVLKGSIRGNDIIARYGGEEFLVIFTNTTDQDVKDRFFDEEKGRLRVGFTTLIKGQEVHVTFSGGFTMVKPGETIDDFKRIVERADLALYESKKGGKDRLTHFTEPETDTSAAL